MSTLEQHEAQRQHGEDKVRKSVIIPEKVFKDGRKRASAELRNFSNYVTWLIEQDVKTNKQPQAAEVGA